VFVDEVIGVDYVAAEVLSIKLFLVGVIKTFALEPDKLD